MLLLALETEVVIEDYRIAEGLSYGILSLDQMATAQVVSPPGQPDIGYTPDLDKYLARVKYRKEHEKLDTSLPPGFPAKLDSDLVWDGAEVEEKYDWTYELNAEELEDIENALRHFKCKRMLQSELKQSTDRDPQHLACHQDSFLRIHFRCQNCVLPFVPSQKNSTMAGASRSSEAYQLQVIHERRMSSYMLASLLMWRRYEVARTIVTKANQPM